jgi:hypothetical protein
MRKITIYQDGEVIELLDDSKEKIENYIKEAGKLFYSNNISILQVTNSALIIRPSKLNSILIEDIEEQQSLLDDTVKEIIKKDEEKAEQQQQLDETNKQVEDIITDLE